MIDKTYEKIFMWFIILILVIVGWVVILIMVPVMLLIKLLKGEPIIPSEFKTIK